MIVYSSPRISAEFEILKTRRPDLWFCVHAVAGILKEKYQIDARITCIYRTDEENSALKAQSRTHVEWRAVDIGARELTTEQRKETIELLNGILSAIPGKMSFCDPRAIHGTGPHFHLQAPMTGKVVFL
jgi:hypothetical protein